MGEIQSDLQGRKLDVFLSAPWDSRHRGKFVRGKCRCFDLLSTEALRSPWLNQLQHLSRDWTEVAQSKKVWFSRHTGSLLSSKIMGASSNSLVRWAQGWVILAKQAARQKSNFFFWFKSPVFIADAAPEGCWDRTHNAPGLKIYH